MVPLVSRGGTKLPLQNWLCNVKRRIWRRPFGHVPGKLRTRKVSNGPCVGEQGQKADITAGVAEAKSLKTRLVARPIVAWRSQGCCMGRRIWWGRRPWQRELPQRRGARWKAAVPERMGWDAAALGGEEKKKMKIRGIRGDKKCTHSPSTLQWITAITNEFGLFRTFQNCRPYVMRGGPTPPFSSPSP